MGKKTLHIISHSHWDREWYMPFENFRIRLVELFNQVLNLLEEDGNGFEAFHADGHVLLIEDYLEVHPEQRSRLEKLVREGKLFVGPWYVLQDAFLTSGEAQVRNLLYGMEKARELGGVTMVGYYPDTFGNISQSAQMLQGFGIKHAVFGRGINPVAENNQVKNEENNGFTSEVWWASPDGSRVLSVFLANWYHNGMELPVDKDEAQKRIDIVVPNVERFATTSHLLLMNGCDHQPVQRDVGTAIRAMNEVLPENYEAVHSNFPRYFHELEGSVGQLHTAVGELTGQITEGYGLLINTASSRLYLKQWNARLQRELERWTEPFSVIADQFGMAYPRHLIRHAWKLLMKNHPHDSICGCSLDEVHREMETRFMKTSQVAEALTTKALTFIASRVPQPQAEASSPFMNGYAITVFNPLERSSGSWVEVEAYSEEAIAVEEWQLLDSVSGQKIDLQVVDEGIVSGFTLPDEQFRIRWKKRKYVLRFHAAKVPALGYTTYYWMPSENNNEAATPKAPLVQSIDGAKVLENERLALTVHMDGRISLTDKRNHKRYDHILTLEDRGDIGDEYNFVQSEDANDLRLGTGGFTSIEDCSVPGVLRLRIEQSWSLPQKREGKQRSKEELTHTFQWLISLEENAARIDVELTWTNLSEDHRLRVLVPTDLQTGDVYADSPFDWTKREIVPWEGWKNPCRTERMQSRVGLKDDKNGFLIATDGLPEYEVLRDGRNTLAITILRCIGELGDWNYFPTPEAQNVGKTQKVRFSLIPVGQDLFEGFNEADAFLYPAKAVAVPIRELTANEGGASGASEVPTRYSLANLEHSDPAVRLTTLKKSENEEAVVLRLVNLMEEPCEVDLKLTGQSNPIVSKGQLDESALSEPLKLEEQDALRSLRDQAGAKRIETYLLKQQPKSKEG
ncbi:alpha-mannosidase [Paenibacillus agaridevorans]|uniref:alpha-mannosidase n=1 Tax=Paenibacillus agaridevorans TaxID=171404 RepID=UPI001BE4B4EB|nr:glycoside hydrolase family 38 C-terminal domain-containing protein [Paenibacillus agaridevorans]